ncbi:Serine/arginine repetitive matrix protein 1 [Rhodotorula toruloides ATCC 204091]|uniref:Serine/arginine repetitive matrix protein 1 n=1 Tax=Rhodotorula toruloides TaxID=5286 RepID=A0A0K3CRE8_RHOTO|nr:Serine/arginine repetitive matrix protein 1 [Rhodotorula toruloides ATCC 204091]PRQ70536.1 Serine/arginine repetitive matrix protein 1 [Rhodotorula toruloides]
MRLRMGPGSPSGSEVGGGMMRRQLGSSKGSPSSLAGRPVSPLTSSSSLQVPFLRSLPSLPPADMSASLDVNSNSMIGIFAYWVGVSGSGQGNGMCNQIPLVGSDSGKDGAGASWWRAAMVGERGDSAMSSVDGARSEGKNGVFSGSAKGEESSLTRASTLSDFAESAILVKNGAEVVVAGPFDGELGQLGPEDGLE